MEKLSPGGIEEEGPLVSGPVRSTKRVHSPFCSTQVTLRPIRLSGSTVPRSDHRTFIILCVRFTFVNTGQTP